MQTNHEYSLSKPVDSDDHAQGPENAPVTLVEYGDYECPYCGQAYPIVKQIQEAMGDNLRFVFRNFPLSQMHEHAFAAAEAAETAADYGKFWEMHDKLYENQRHLDGVHLVAYATELGIPTAEFSQKMLANEKAARVKADFMSGVESGVNGTPSFYINGNKYNGSWDYATLLTALKEVV